MENKEKVMDDCLFNLNFTMSKSGLKMVCHVVLISTIHCITEMISTHCGMSSARKVVAVNSVWRGVPYQFLSKRCTWCPNLMVLAALKEVGIKLC